MAGTFLGRTNNKEVRYNFATFTQYRSRLIQERAYPSKSLCRRTVITLHQQGFFIFALCSEPVALRFIGAAEIHVRIVVARVSGSMECSLEPWNCGVRITFL